MRDGRRGVWRLALGALALSGLLAGCGEKPLPANPALWRVDGPHGERGWLFGTIHTLPRPVAWQTPAVSAALAQSDRLVLEIAAVNDDAATARAFDRLAHTKAQPPIDQKLPPQLRPQLARLMARGGLTPARFADLESWAAAIVLAQVAEKGSDSGNGIDRALIPAAKSKPIAELEGAASQLALFDALPEASQRNLLAEVVAGADTSDADMRRLAEIWRRGDMAALAVQTRTGLLADPTLRHVLFSQRNLRWSHAIAAMLAAGVHPFVAVGAAHMAGPEGLPAMLSANGFSVTRVE